MFANLTPIPPDQNRELYDRVKERMQGVKEWEPQLDEGLVNGVLSYYVGARGADLREPRFYVKVNVFTLQIEHVDLDANGLVDRKDATSFTGEEVKQLYIAVVLGKLTAAPGAKQEGLDALNVPITMSPSERLVEADARIQAKLNVPAAVEPPTGESNKLSVRERNREATLIFAKETEEQKRLDALSLEAQAAYTQLEAAFRQYGDGPLKIPDGALDNWERHDWDDYIDKNTSSGLLPNNFMLKLGNSFGDALHVLQSDVGITAYEEIVFDAQPPERLRRGGVNFEQVYVSQLAKHLVPILTGQNDT